MTLWKIKSDKGYLRGNGTATNLVWHKSVHNGNFYKTRVAAEKTIKRLLDRREPVKAEICEIEIIVHGTINEIMEREVLGEN